MPYIDASISKSITPQQESDIKALFGSAIALFPGKSETWLMCKIADNSHIWFKGDNTEPACFIEVKLFGSVEASAANRFTAAVCEGINRIAHIPSERIYIRFSGGNLWGWNGSNF